MRSRSRAPVPRYTARKLRPSASAVIERDRERELRAQAARQQPPSHAGARSR